MKNLIFLDIDGVLNCQLFFEEKRQAERVREAKEPFAFEKGNICRERLEMFNTLCRETDSAVVLSSTWRTGKTVEWLQKMFLELGGTFQLLDKTGQCPSRIRGAEIAQWLEINCKAKFGVDYFDFYRYVIIDDDSDMLLNQAAHFFQTDSYAGLTPNTCYKIKRFLTKKTFD
jgi:hypothetical protein